MKSQQIVIRFNSRRNLKQFRRHLRGAYVLQARPSGEIWCMPKSHRTGVAVILPSREAAE
jgi:hypothetical protein